MPRSAQVRAVRVTTGLWTIEAGLLTPMLAFFFGLIATAYRRRRAIPAASIPQRHMTADINAMSSGAGIEHAVAHRDLHHIAFLP